MTIGPDRLVVRLFGEPAGKLEIDGPLHSPEDWRFRYYEAYLARAESCPLSTTLPLRPQPFEGAVVRNWFCNLLPEGLVREAIEQRLRIPPRDDFAMLAAIGGECAGAVSIGPRGSAAPDDMPSDAADLATTLQVHDGDEAGEGAWAAIAAPNRLSLAGAQDKIAVVVEPGGQLRLPRLGEPSTHILKPESRVLPGLRDLELLGLTLARAVGLQAVAASPVDIAGRKALLVERYDRALDRDDNRVRLHQEDFCQALGMPGELKYQAQGGPSLARCAGLLRTTLRLGPPALQGFLDWIIYNVLIGNADAHAKNLALLRDAAGTLALAPFYDMVPTIVYPESMVERTPALDIGGAPRIDAVERRHWERLATETGYARGFVMRRVSELAGAVVEAMPNAVAVLVEGTADATRVERAASVIVANATATKQRALLAG